MMKYNSWIIWNNKIYQMFLVIWQPNMSTDLKDFIFVAGQNSETVYFFIYQYCSTVHFTWPAWSNKTSYHCLVCLWSTLVLTRTEIGTFCALTGYYLLFTLTGGNLREISWLLWNLLALERQLSVLLTGSSNLPSPFYSP